VSWIQLCHSLLLLLLTWQLTFQLTVLLLTWHCHHHTRQHHPLTDHLASMQECQVS
jgi:hypothetical protein